MKILLFEDNENRLRENIDLCVEMYSGATIVPVHLSSQATADEVIKSIQSQHEFEAFDYVFTDVNMPTPERTRDLLYRLRKNNLLAPIVLISTDYGNQTIPTDILGANARENETLYRRTRLPSIEEMHKMRAFESKDNVPPEKTIKSNIIALCILCQGYIAAHAKLSDTNGDIRKALERMGWDRVPPELQTKVKEKQTQVREVSWWRVFGHDNAQLPAKIKSEWDEGWTDDSDVDQLVKMISSDTAIDIDNEKAVAKAYLQLSSKLGE